jgi:hypothetical protein
MIMPTDQTQLLSLKEILANFSASTGLQVNYNKTTLVPINVDSAHANSLANIFGCKVESLPFTYLGLPLGTTRPSVADLMPLVSRLDKKLSGISSLMSYTRRLTLLNSVINSLPMFAMCSLKVPITIFIHFEKSGRQFLWADREDKIQGKCLASWDLICRPKDEGGLGVIDLRKQNKALLIKNLHKFYNCHDLPWVNLLWRAYYSNGQVPSQNANKGSFWWKDCLLFDNLYKEHTTINVFSGKSCMLWSGNWIDSIREEDLPHLPSFAKNKHIIVLEAWNKNNEDLYDLFNLPLSITAHEEFHTLQDELNSLNITTEHDRWVFA